MSAVAFDTLKFAQTLRDKAKFTPEQAEGLSEAFSQASADQLATRSDIAELRTDLRADIAGLRNDVSADIAEVRAEIAGVRTELRADIADVRSELRQTELRLEAKIESFKSDILRWMFGTIGFQAIVILGAVLALSRFGR